MGVAATLHWKTSLFCNAQVTTPPAVPLDFMDRVLILNGRVVVLSFH